MSKILSITWYKVLPPQYGGQKGIALFTKWLSQKNQVLLVCSKNNERLNDLPFQVRAELPVSKFQFLNPFCWKKIVSIAEEFQPDFIILEHPYHGIAATKAARKTNAKLVVHSHNIEAERFRLLGKWFWFLLSGFEKKVHQKAQMNLFKTTHDMTWAIQNFHLESSKCMIVPYGIERPNIDRAVCRKKILSRHGISEQEKILLFAGTLDYEPNAKAVEIIFKKIAPRLQGKNIRILICGRNELSQYQFLKKLIHPTVIYVGEVDNIDEYFAAADLFIDPVITGGGIQSKIIEALSHDLDIVCFDTMIDEQLRLAAGEKIFSAAEGDYDNLVKNIPLALERNTLTPARFFEQYSWEKIIARLNEKLSSIHAN